MSFYTIVRREKRKSGTGITYKVEVWRGFQGYVAEVLPIGSNIPIAKRYANSPEKAWQLAIRWLESYR